MPSVVLHTGPARDKPSFKLLHEVELVFYGDQTKNWRLTELRFICFGSKAKGKVVSKQSVSRYTVTAAYESAGVPPPERVTDQSTKSVARTLFEGVTMKEICNVAVWSSTEPTRHTFARFYRRDVASDGQPGFSTRVLSAVKPYTK